MANSIEPSRLKSDFQIVETARSRHDFSALFSNVKRIFELSREELKSALEKVKECQQNLEQKSRPPGGYELHIINYSSKQRNFLEVYLEACEERPAGTEIEMVKMEGCPFCGKQEIPECAQRADSLARVILSSEGKPLVISAVHYPHLFASSVNVQVDMILAGEDAVKYRKNGTSDAYSHLRFHVGLKGHQFGVPHSHMHVDI